MFHALPPVGGRYRVYRGCDALEWDRVVVAEGEPLENALRRFGNVCRAEHERPWTKRRYGCHESAGVLRRRRKKLKWLNTLRTTRTETAVTWNPQVDLITQFRRTGPINSVCR